MSSSYTSNTKYSSIPVFSFDNQDSRLHKQYLFATISFFYQSIMLRDELFEVILSSVILYLSLSHILDSINMKQYISEQFSL